MGRRVATLVCALVLVTASAGCGGGGGDPETRAQGAGGTSSIAPLPPDATPQPLGYGKAARTALGRGAIGVVDLSNTVQIEPARLAVNAEQELSALRWSGWGGPRTTARGKVRTLICDPTCAQGRLEDSAATLVLSVPRRCDGQRFYAEASMTYREPGSGRTRAPTTYLRTPC